MEIWKILPGYDEYLISNFGRVKSIKFNKEKILKPSLNNGYQTVVISKDKKQKHLKYIN